MNGLFMDSCLTLVELLKEVLCVRYILDYKYKKVLNGWRLIALPLIILTECASSMATGGTFGLILRYAFNVWVIILIFDDKVINNIYKSIIAIPFVSALDIAYSIICIHDMSSYELIARAASQNYFVRFITESYTLFFLWIPLSIVVSYFKNIKRYMLAANNRINTMILTVSISVLIFGIQELMTGIKNSTVIYEILLGVTGLLVCVVLINVHSSIKDIRYKENDKRIKDILEQQKRYCELIDDQNIETRSFRHDMNAHMNSISYLIERRMYKELDNYIKELTKSYSAIPKRVDVGNYIADAIVQETVYEAKKINADFEYRGRMTEAMKDREYDICIILSNLLNNAIEAVEKLSDDSPKNIRLDIRNYNNKTIIIDRNKDIVNNVSLITTKADVRDHGFGLYNVKKSVKALKGDMKISHRESEFVVTITI